MTVEEVQHTVDHWIRTVGVRYFSPLTNMAVLTEEVGEVARLIARIDGDQSFKPGESADALADELADVVWVVAAIANQHGIDLTSAFLNNLDKKTIRDKDRHRENDKLKSNNQ
ncbi:MAG: nucleotide pyrophosphohydrolase [Barnesiella sp.]|nr:nucleotide pyrophosphohydrolase [Barnesiella sp.]